MKRIDKLYMKALKIKPRYDDICIISNETGCWKIEGKEYTSLEAAERDAYLNYTAKDNDLLIIINDAGEGDILEKVVNNDRNQAKSKDTCRSEKNNHKNNEYDCKRKNGRKNGEYNNFWV